MPSTAERYAQSLQPLGSASISKLVPRRALSTVSVKRFAVTKEKNPFWMKRSYGGAGLIATKLLPITTFPLLPVLGSVDFTPLCTGEGTLAAGVRTGKMAEAKRRKLQCQPVALARRPSQLTRGVMNNTHRCPSLEKRRRVVARRNSRRNSRPSLQRWARVSAAKR